MRSILSSLFIFSPNQFRRFFVVEFSPAWVKAAYIESVPEGFRLLDSGVQKLAPAQRIDEEKDLALREEGSAAILKRRAADGAPETSPDKTEDLIFKFLNRFLKEKPAAASEVKINLSDHDAVVVKYLELPVLPQGEILSAAKWQLKEEVPFNLDDSRVEWQILKEFTDEEGVKKTGIIFVIVKKQLVDSCLAVTQRCHLDPALISIPSVGYLSFLRAIPNAAEVSAVVDIGAQDSTLSIYHKNQLFFVRKLPVSKEKFIQSLTGGLVTEKGRIQLSWDEAEKIKDLYGIPLETSPDMGDQFQPSHVMSLIRPVLESLSREIKFSFDYFASNFELARPSALYLAGEGANFKNLDGYLAKDLGLDVSFLPWPQNVILPVDVEKKSDDDVKKKKMPPAPVSRVSADETDVGSDKKIINAQGSIPVLNQKAISGINAPPLNPPLASLPISSKEQEILQWKKNIFASLLGTALADSSDVNLLPPELRNKRTKKLINFFGFLSIVAVGVFVLFALISSNFQLKVYKDKLKSAQTHLQKIDGIRILKERIILREGLILNIREGKIPADGILRIISAVIPDDMILDELSIDQINHSLSIKGNIPVGENSVDAIITDFMGKLESSPFFSEASLVSSQKVGIIQKFEIKCELAK